ncbi:predicted protein [Histoplasma capsulatum H143]|uniref:Uncharacterized protein n=1 Tax=Ajellomyces capsulatus (strain H143) TaxID=544712 RepID=C6HI69_AJECH|nr:predicted protein [Histoplasma capsulatum H143]
MNEREYHQSGTSTAPPQAGFHRFYCSGDISSDGTGNVLHTQNASVDVCYHAASDQFAKGVDLSRTQKSGSCKGRVPNRADFAIGMWKVSPLSFCPMQILGSPSVIQTLLEDILTRRSGCDRDEDINHSASENIFDIELRRLITPAVGLKDGIAPADGIHAEVRSQHSNDTAGSPSDRPSRREQEQEVKAARVPELLIYNTTAADLSHPLRVPSVMVGRRGCRTQAQKPQQSELNHAADVLPIQNRLNRCPDGSQSHLWHYPFFLSWPADHQIMINADSNTSSGSSVDRICKYPSRATSISPVSDHHDAKAGEADAAEGQDTNSLARPARTRTAHVLGVEFPFTQGHDLPEKIRKSMQRGVEMMAQACPIQVNWSSYAFAWRSVKRL